MAIAVAVWSVVLEPGEPIEINPPSDLRITNAALSDELADETGRTTIKLSYKIPVPSDSEDENEEEDEDHEGHEHGHAEISTTVLCSLTPGKVEQTTVDLILEADEDYIFEVVGKNSIYLTGNYIDQTPPDQVPFNDESDDEDMEGAYDLREVSSDVEIDPEEMDIPSDDGGRFEEVNEEQTAQAATKKDASKKRPRESDVTETDGDKLSKSQKKKLKKLKGVDGKAVATGTEEAPSAATKAPKDGEAKKEKKEKKKKTAEGGEKEKTKEKVLSGGLKITDSKVGTGPQAKKGDTVSMRYIGKLLNGKVFDSNLKGKPFKFRLGQGEVIKGWDEGVVGMHVGSERVLEVPAPLAYGKRKMSDIPANSTLRFEVKLISID
ncbi:hypothetical protein B0H21DRAFT_757649 [Amylocystis lapponica]|nr:hypothetical protein B0H21DRAFT_757649 [Amylocystis lapponica]